MTAAPPGRPGLPAAAVRLARAARRAGSALRGSCARHWPRTRRQRRTTVVAAAFAVLLALWTFGRGDPAPMWPRAAILAAIRFVESSDRDDPPDGDGGRAIGPYQIHEVYWRDAVEFAPEIGGGYQDCRRRDYAERIIDAYMRRYVPAAWQRGDAEVIARTHNGGPRGADKAATHGYWLKVRERLP